MISIVICSREKAISQQLIDNIEKTVGVQFELIVIDNSQNNYSIFEAYNLGIEKSKGEYLCFLHDDIQIHTQNWGKILESIFQNDAKIGLIGVAGTKVKTKMPSAWWDCSDEELQINIIQHFPNKDKEHWKKGFINSNLVDVVIIDGVFMVGRKIDGILFNKELQGFHNYDLNLAFEYLKKNYKIVATNEILLEHFSLGVLNKSWFASTVKIHKLYNKTLPLNLSKIDLKILEFKNGVKFIEGLIKVKMKKEAFYVWLKLIGLKPKSKFHFKLVGDLFK